MSRLGIVQMPMPLRHAGGRALESEPVLVSRVVGMGSQTAQV
jgi:hypothetical protein